MKISLKDLVEGADSILKKNEDELVWDKDLYQIKHQKWNVGSIEKISNCQDQIYLIALGPVNDLLFDSLPYEQETEELKVYKLMKVQKATSDIEQELLNQLEKEMKADWENAVQETIKETIGEQK